MNGTIIDPTVSTQPYRFRFNSGRGGDIIGYRGTDIAVVIRNSGHEHLPSLSFRLHADAAARLGRDLIGSAARADVGATDGPGAWCGADNGRDYRVSPTPTGRVRLHVRRHSSGELLDSASDTLTRQIAAEAGTYLLQAAGAARAAYRDAVAEGEAMRMG